MLMERSTGSPETLTVDEAGRESPLEFLFCQLALQKYFKRNAMKTSSLKTLLTCACACGSSMLFHPSVSVAQSVSDTNTNQIQNGRFLTPRKNRLFERTVYQQHIAMDATPRSRIEHGHRHMNAAWRGEKDPAARRRDDVESRKNHGQTIGRGRYSSVNRPYPSRTAIATSWNPTSLRSEMAAVQRIEQTRRYRQAAAGCNCSCPNCVDGQCNCAAGRCDCPSGQCGCQNGRCRNRRHSTQNSRGDYRGEFVTRRNSQSPHHRSTGFSSRS